MGASSQHFSNEELACHCCGVNNCTAEIVDALEQFRAVAGLPILIDDAYRCAIHNIAVGGSPNSQHLLGKAADIRVTGLTAKQLEEIARTLPIIKGIGRAPFQNYLHIDVRDTPFEWCYNKDGREVPYYA